MRLKTMVLVALLPLLVQAESIVEKVKRVHTLTEKIELMAKEFDKAIAKKEKEIQELGILHNSKK